MLAREYALMEQMPEDLSGLVSMSVDYFEQGDTAYLVRTYLPGRPLSEIWRQDTPCLAERCAYIGIRLCALLERLHDMEPSVIHRDIKPENIILSTDGEGAVAMNATAIDCLCMGCIQSFTARSSNPS